MGIFPKDRDLTQAPECVELPVRSSDFRVPVAELAIRLDAFLAHHLTWRSRSSIQKLVKEGYVAVDPATPDHPHGSGELHLETRCGRKLAHGSTVVVTIPEPLRLQIASDASSPLEVLFEDDWVLAIDKPPNVPVHPSGRHLGDTLIQRVHAHYGGRDPHGQGVLKLCHRLDMETSGVLLVARERAAHAELMGQFEERRVEKEYLALVRGEPERDEGLIDLPLGPSRVSAVRLKMAVVADGLPSRTTWRVLERARDCALVSCKPITGRQHQLRVHLAAIGHPLVGDKLYGPDEEIFLRHARGDLSPADLRLLGLARHGLHDHRLVFSHPVRGERMEVVSPLPADMRDWIRSQG